MKVFDRYFSKNSEVLLTDFPERVDLIVILPVFDDPDVFRTLDSLNDCRKLQVPVGVIVAVNYAENCSLQVKVRNQQLAQALQEYVSERPHPGIHYHIIRAFDLPARSAGVGLARKIAMDAAAFWFYRNAKPDGIIASLDADTLVGEDYFPLLREAFTGNTRAGVALDFRHVWEKVCPPTQISAICKYELYLRYYRMCLAFIGHPYAFTCLGSAFAVRARDYVAEGGMNKRQAGEDFYFIQKLIATGRFARLKTVCVYPSARLSVRTPFGTGQAVKQILKESGEYVTYCFEAFRILKFFFAESEKWFRLSRQELNDLIALQPVELREFLKETDFQEMLQEVNANSASFQQFRKRFFDNFNAFRVLKCLNYMHTHFFTRQPVENEARKLAGALGWRTDHLKDVRELLEFFREKDREI